MTPKERAAMQQAEVFIESLTGLHTDVRQEQKEILLALRKALKQSAEQEPVAWMFEFPDKRMSPKFDVWSHGGKWKPLYTAPPQREWVSLTGQDLCDLEVDTKWSSDSHDFDIIARTIEAKLKEKNCG